MELASTELELDNSEVARLDFEQIKSFFWRPEVKIEDP